MPTVRFPHRCLLLASIPTARILRQGFAEWDTRYQTIAGTPPATGIGREPEFRPLLGNPDILIFASGATAFRFTDGRGRDAAATPLDLPRIPGVGTIR